jgi:hypothetical protein
MACVSQSLIEVPELAWDQLTRGCRLFVRFQWFKTAIEPHELEHFPN